MKRMLAQRKISVQGFHLDASIITQDYVNIVFCILFYNYQFKDNAKSPMRIDLTQKQDSELRMIFS